MTDTPDQPAVSNDRFAANVEQAQAALQLTPAEWSELRKMGGFPEKTDDGWDLPAIAQWLALRNAGDVRDAFEAIQANEADFIADLGVRARSIAEEGGLDPQTLTEADVAAARAEIAAYAWAVDGWNRFNDDLGDGLIVSADLATLRDTYWPAS